jgi:UDP-glucose 4-epimerase
MNNILVTGAHGFLGRHTCLEFKKHGCHVTGIGIGRWIGSEMKDFGLDSWHEADLNNMDAESMGDGYDVIVHCAGGASVSYSVEHPSGDFMMTVGTIHALLEYMRKYCPGARLVYPSSAAVYGEKPDRPIKTTDSVTPVSPYGYHKKIAEDLCSMYSCNYGIRASIIRFFSIYGTGLKKQLMWDACNKFMKGRGNAIFAGTGLETRDWIHINDAVSLLYAAARYDLNVIVNGASGRRTTNRDLLESVAETLGLQGAVAFNGEKRKGDPLYYHADISDALQTGWEPGMELARGIGEYVAWFRSSI